jgi:PEP-CTERM motif-containing protein
MRESFTLSKSYRCSRENNTIHNAEKPTNRPEGFRGRRGSFMIKSRKSALISTFAILLSLTVLTRPSVAQSYDAAGDFSTSGNPNGVWSYGWSTTLGSAFNLDSVKTNTYSGTNLSGWLTTLAPDGSPLILHNGTGSPVTLGNSTFQPGQLALGPGLNLQYSVLRWTALSSGTFNINATFSGLSALGDTSDVHILHDGVSIFNSNVTGSPAPESYSGSQSITAGDTIDFAVGVGSNGNYDEDLTALSATIVPEPGTLGLVGMSLVGLLSFRFLKRK